MSGSPRLSTHFVYWAAPPETHSNVPLEFRYRPRYAVSIASSVNIPVTSAASSADLGHTGAAPGPQFSTHSRSDVAHSTLL